MIAHQLDLEFDTTLSRKSQAVFFPMAPSVNTLWRMTRGGNRVPTEVYDVWADHARWVIHSQRDLWTKVEGPVLLQFLFERRSLLSDVDNRLKATIDALCKNHVMDDDRKVIGICVSWCPMGTVVDWARMHELPATSIEGLQASKDGAGVVRINPLLPGSNNKFTFSVAPDSKGGVWTSQEEPPHGIDAR